MSTLATTNLKHASSASNNIVLDSSGNATLATAKITTLADSAGSNTSTPAEIASGRAKAWVNFNGTSTVAIRASYNVSSITDGGTGRYTVNFTTALSDANYSFQMHCIDVTGANRTIIAGGNTTGTAPTASALTFGTFASAATTETDADYIAVAVFR